MRDDVKPAESGAARVDAVVVGAGFAGLYALHRLRQLGLRVKAFEAGQDVGGVWFWNRYPGARCDAESLLYSYSFDEHLQKDWKWSERFATQPEILAYLNHVADRFDLRRDICLNTQVTDAVFDEASGLWQVHTSDGQHVQATYCIMATGPLSAGRVPPFKGFEDFKGQHYITSNWPHEGVSFEGKRVGVIGTGSTGIQLIPEIAKQAESLTVFQRTPNFSVPARNQPLTPEQIASFYRERTQYRHLSRLGLISSAGDTLLSPDERAPAAASALAVPDDVREKAYEKRWEVGGAYFVATFPNIMIDDAANATAADFVRNKIKQIVQDPAVAERLCPKDYPLGAKRICVDTNYFETYNLPNVELVDIQANDIEGFSETGLRAGGIEYPLDIVVFATGFDALTGALLKINIKGRDGLPLREAWEAGPRSYLGLGIAGFPNLFPIGGPGSPSVLSNVVTSIEQHVEWIGDCIAYMREHGLSHIEARTEDQDKWVEHVSELARMTLFAKGKSWYLGANIPGKPQVFMPYIGGVGAYREICDRVAANGYEGFALSRPGENAAPTKERQSNV